MSVYRPTVTSGARANARIVTATVPVRDGVLVFTKDSTQLIRFPKRSWLARLFRR